MSSDGQITVTGLTRAKRVKRRYDAVLSVQDPDQRNGLRFHSAPHPDHLIIRCADLDYPAPEPYGSAVAGLRVATREQVAEAIEFGRRHHQGSLLVHCNVGVARSTAMALAILADRMGKGREADALAEVIRIREIAVPNLMICQYADDILGRGGAIVAAVLARDSEVEFCRQRRLANRAAYLGYYRVPRETWDVVYSVGRRA